MALSRVLYVDDEEINLELLQLTFMNELDVVTATSAQEGLLILDRNQDIQVIISDLKMPEMNGLDFIKEIKNRYDNRICMLLTGFMESEIMMEGFNKELIFRYIMKPWKKDVLMEAIHQAFKRQAESI
jgi:CheY-like chemotaxis protein